MSSQLHASPSQRNRISREGYNHIPHEHQDTSYYGGNMGHSQNNDATIDIPLEPVPTSTSSGGGLRNPHTGALDASMTNEEQPPLVNEKKGFFRGRRAKPVDGQLNGTGNKGYDGEEDVLTTMGKIYNKIYSFSIITRYMLYVVPVGLLIAIPIIVGAIIGGGNNPPAIGGVPIVWFFSWIEIIWCSLWASKIVAHFLPYVFQLFVGVVSSGVRKYATVIRALEIQLSLVGWAVTSLATFKPVMERNPYNRTHAGKISGNGKWVDIVQKILAAALVSTLVFLAERFFIQLISINYHRKQFNSRIKDSKRQIYILGLLYDASRMMFPAFGNEFYEEDIIISDQLQLSKLGGKKKGHKRNGSATPMRLFHNIGRFGDQVTSAFGNVASEITGKEMFNANSAHSIVITALERKRTSEALARRIWMSFVVEGREALLEEDIVDVLGSERKAEAEEAYENLDRDANGDISLDEMIITVVEWGRERKAIANSMVDVAQAINVLDRMLCTVVMVAVIFIFIAFLNTNFVTTLATTGTALLSLSFVFSVTAQEILGSCIFLFVKHPFDIGDRVDIAADRFTVEHISLLFTVFRRATGPKTGQLCQYPNIVLNSLSLDNVSRSKAQTEQVILDVSFDTSFDDIQILKNELNKFVAAPENNRDFQAEFEVEILGTTDMSKLQLQVDIMHKSNWGNETLRASRRSKFMCALVAALRAVPIYPPGGGIDAQGSAAAPNYSVTISDSEAKENAQHTAQEREEARLIPIKKIQEAKDADPLSPGASSGRPGMAGMTTHDRKIITDLTSRDPASDPARDQAWTSTRNDDDSSTLGGRPSVDQQDLNEVRGLLHRQSTRGKRKPSTEQSRTAFLQPGVPTIHEPSASGAHPSVIQQQPSFGSYAPAQSYHQQTAYRPTLSTQPTQYQSAQTQLPTVAPTSPIEMSQVNRSASNPYRNRSNLGPTTGGRNNNDDDDEFGDMRPYSGV
ncbi:Mechanosensitive ion channel protein [Fulvia fulva]|uniref:Mechanosensitive ion channel protein n=1 Tax=Passalora fulva TaxID=5499 RepID=A0A9Q8PBT8_PASFU|nr:Mechanosensitive ion channel protein [Fulvia fulva]KAK4620900.1 Mechanosensitive ion channel protein [Fulvia fulva]UJO19597.1 Mechanosensitive ion channel protein [Fulvia fulva]